MCPLPLVAKTRDDSLVLFRVSRVYACIIAKQDINTRKCIVYRYSSYIASYTNIIYQSVYILVILPLKIDHELVVYIYN